MKSHMIRAQNASKLGEGSSRADIERHYTCVKGAGRCPRAHARAKSTCARRKPPKKNEWNKWKNHFYEMQGDVGMSLHEKERNKKMPTPRHKVTHNPIPTSLFLTRLQRTFSCRQLDVKMLCCAVCFAYIMHS